MRLTSLLILIVILFSCNTVSKDTPKKNAIIENNSVIDSQLEKAIKREFHKQALNQMTRLIKKYRRSSKNAAQLDFINLKHLYTSKEGGVGTWECYVAVVIPNGEGGTDKFGLYLKTNLDTGDDFHKQHILIYEDVINMKNK